MICQLIVCDRLTDGTFSEERKVRLEIDANVGSVEFQVKLDQKVQFSRDSQRQKYNRLRCLLVLVICFYLHWSGNTLPIRTNIIKVGSKSWLLTCSSNIILSIPSYTGSSLKRELKFCNGYLTQKVQLGLSSVGSSKKLSQGNR